MDRVAFVAFTYGTLLSEKVLLAILGRVPQRIDAKLSGYSRAPIRGQCYPAVFKADGSSFVKGKLLLELSEKELLTLDDFEDPAYDRATVEVETVDGKRSNVRLWARPDGHVTDLIRERDWDFEQFKAEHEGNYVERCQQWAALSTTS